MIGAAFTPAQAQATTATCRELNIPVTVGLLLPGTVFGKLCVPPRPTHTVQLLIPGATYNGTYWDPPTTPGVHSYRKSQNAAGYATLTVDRLGSGRSSVPPGVTLTALIQAEVMHQVISKLRNGAFGPRFDKVIIVGHSLGSAISVLEAATFGKVDGVLLTGIAHRINPLPVAALFTTFYPAALDPVLSRKYLDPVYLTTRPGTRNADFFLPGKASPEAIALDEATKDVFAATEAPDGLGVSVFTPYTLLIGVPVLLAISRDPLLCDPLLAIDCTSAETVRAAEAPYYSPAARLRTYLLPGEFGHSFNYAPNANEFFSAAAAWADEFVGR
ncbi:alpha/beta hydrolase [Amycolatopsis anabasis]|uniref:alpha/beta hydrolase n=1 Tax=Amycolatopsis anabasis TaxID=1840409 RepID=UPI00131E576F|nr:alpha/beta hydrolase [Amycolatopsis anabasis]